MDALVPPMVTSPIRYVAPARSAATTVWVMRQGVPIVPARPRLLDRVPAALRVRHYRAGVLGHRGVTPTVMYAHVLSRGPAAVRSPTDRVLGP